ncbi:hypothetical protein HY450_01585 [Candidatus Pacearchaeota archaeon]|nr:hypothetical protein [Candidatus Pacearchaeota archaeon]
MVLKKFKTGRGHTVSLERRFYNYLYLTRSIGGDLSKIENVPEKLLIEMENFIKRNSLINPASFIDGSPVYYCCPKCLKAYSLQTIKKMSLGKEVKELIKELLICESGHNNYFIDDGNLRFLFVS